MIKIILLNFTAISPIAHVALLQTEILSGFKFCASIGIKSPKFNKNMAYNIYYNFQPVVKVNNITNIGIN